MLIDEVEKCKSCIIKVLFPYNQITILSNQMSNIIFVKYANVNTGESWQKELDDKIQTVDASFFFCSLQQKRKDTFYMRGIKFK